MARVSINLTERTVVIKTADAVYVDTLANFALDAQREAPALPAKVERVLFDAADGRVIVITGQGEQTEVKLAAVEAGLRWMIGAIGSILAARTAREAAATPPPAVERDARLTALEQRVAALEARLGPMK